MTLDEVSYLIGMAGTVAFAVTAVLAVAPKGIDLFGASVLGIITAIGGGTVRDLILDVPVFWSEDLNYLWVALASSFAAFSAKFFFTRKGIYRLLLYLDGLAVALFAIQATEKVWDLQFGLPLGPILLGIVTAIGGGLIRDVLAGRETLLMSRELYAIPVMFGCLLFTAILNWLPDHRFVGGLACMFLIFGIRATAIRWNLQVPGTFMTKVGPDP